MSISARAAVSAVAAAALVAWPAALAAQGYPFPRSASVALSSARAGARPVALSLVLGYEMQCGYPGPGPVTVELPAAERVPPRLAPSQLLVDGQAAAGVTVAAHAVRVELPPPPRVMCDVIGPGRLTLAFTPAADLGNPARPGSYTVAASRGGLSFAAAFTIRAG